MQFGVRMSVDDDTVATAISSQCVHAFWYSSSRSAGSYFSALCVSAASSQSQADNGGRGRPGSLTPPLVTTEVLQKIDVNPPKGTRDFTPRKCGCAISCLVISERLFGFEEVDFPVLESEALFIRKAGEEIREQLYSFEDQGNRRVALRPELSPSLARLVIQNGKSASLPLKWFAVGQCWRYERMTRGRRREHYQWNMDIIGVPEVTAEAELISSIVMLFRRMGITESDVGFKISSRKVLQEVLKSYSIPDNLFGKVCIIIDKIQKIPRDEIKKELGIVGLSDDAIEELLQVLSIKSLDKLEEGHGGLLLVHLVSASSVDQLYVVPFLGDLSCSAALGNVALKLERAFPVDNNNETVELSYLKSRDKVNHGRRLDSVDGVVDFPVDGVDPYLVGLYFTRVQLGTPPKEFYVQIDTGSDVLWVTCAGCTGCPCTSGLNVNSAILRVEFTFRFHLGKTSQEVLGSKGDAIADLKQLFSLAENFGYSNWIQFDASIVRGLAYYTGIVFEGFNRQGKLRAICGGGRLLSTFGGDDIPACGFGFGDSVIVEPGKSWLINRHVFLSLTCWGFNAVCDEEVLVMLSMYLYFLVLDVIFKGAAAKRIGASSCDQP
ncbi:unnamed protein product [Rhodiola kirilowii]